LSKAETQKAQGGLALQPLLETVVRRLHERLGDDLQSVVLYGSYARGEADAGSDLDLMVIVPNLPHEWREVFAMEDQLAGIGREIGHRLDVRLFEPEAVSHAVTWTSPLMLEIGDAHEVLFDREGSLAAEIKRFREIAEERGIYRIAPGVWRVPSLAGQ
jgi:predicted nucleotidyltransferase